MEQKGIRGVSPVVGTILLIAITVALAAVVATLVSGLGGKGTPPSAMLTVMAENGVGSKLKLTISHEGGDDLVLKDLKVSAGMTVPLTDNTDLGTGIFTVGMTKVVYIDAVTVSKNDVVTVYIIHVPSKQKIFSATNVVVR